MFNVTARKFSPPYGDGTFNVIIKNYMDTFSPPYGDGTQTQNTERGKY